jgi:hypothetical protein
VVHGRTGCFDPHLMAEIREYVTVELLCIVGYYLSGHSKIAYYIFANRNF